MIAGPEERQEFLDVVQAQVFPYMPPSASFGPLQPELRETRNGRIQVGATLRGSIVVTVRPRRFPVLHWPRPVG